METNQTSLPELWTIDQLAEYLGVGRRFVYRLTHERRIAFCKMGGELRFRASDVAAFVADSVEPVQRQRRAPVERRGRPRSPYARRGR